MSSHDGAVSVAEQLEREHAIHRRRVLQAVGLAILPFPVAAILLGQDLVALRVAIPLVVVGLGALGAIVLARRGRIRAGTTLIALVVTSVAADAHVLLRISVMSPAYAALLVALGMMVLERRAAAFQAAWLVLAVIAMRIGRALTGDGPEPWFPTTLDAVTLVGVIAVMGLVDRQRVERDRTLLYRAVTDIEHQRRDLEQARHQADSSAKAATLASELKSQFLARISHELRTPLNAILGYGELLQEGDELSGEARSDVDRICAAARHQLRLVDDLLDLTRVESGQIGLHLETVDLGALMEPVVDAARALSRDKGLGIVASVEPASVLVDVGRVRQILLNLVSNATRFTDTGEIRIEARVVDGLTTFVISDTGIGVRKDRVALLFQPFVQAERETAYRYGGTGLGLAITDRLVRAMGGTVRFESELGRGTTVTVTIPRFETDERTTSISFTPGA